MAAERAQSLEGLNDPRILEYYVYAIPGAHAHVELCSVALEALMAGDERPEPAHFSAIRLRLAQANLTRTQVAREACSHLITNMSPGETEAIRDLEQSEIAHFQAISEHIRTWPPAKVQDDWLRYCAATRKVLDRVRDLVMTEKRVLLPLLRAKSRKMSTIENAALQRPHDQMRPERLGLPVDIKLVPSTRSWR